MNTPILVTGGTGRLGRHVVARLRDAGREVRVLSRKGQTSADGLEYVRGDLHKGDGIEAAVDGAAIIVHLAALGGTLVRLLKLVTPGLRYLCDTFVAVPVLVAERKPMQASLQRSARLARGRARGAPFVPRPPSRGRRSSRPRLL